MNFLKKGLIIFSTVPLVSAHALAQGRSKIIGDLPSAPITKPSEVSAVIIVYIKWFVGFFWITAIAFTVLTAFHFMTAQGDEKKITAAKKSLKYTLVAAVIALLANGIQLIAQNLLKAN